MDEETLLLIKPDAIQKGLIGVILDSLQKQSLNIGETVRIQLNQDDIEALYAEFKDSCFYSELVEFLTSVPVILLKIKGENAVYKIKHKVIGKYYSQDGLRRIYSENRIKNIAHASEDSENAIKEIQYFEKYFQKERQRNKERFSNVNVFALTGMSECGKSTVGRYFNSKGIPRLKIVKIFESVRDKKEPSKDLRKFIEEQEQKDPFTLWDSFIDELMIEMQRLALRNASIESLYGGGLGPYLKQRLGKSFCLIFIDAPLKIRLQRQIIREGLKGGIEEAKKLLLPRDQFKTATGLPQLKEIADEVVDNSTTTKKLYQQIDRLINKYSKKGR